MKVMSAPEKVTLNLTNRCNLDCLYCGVSETRHAPGDLCPDEWLRLIEELAKIKVFRLTLSGGEPFLCPEFDRILAHILRYPFRITINTNGTRFTEAALSRLQGVKKLQSIQVSIDGGNAAIHDAVRGQGSFDATIEGVGKLRRRGIPFHFFSVVHRFNADHLESTIRLAKRLKATAVHFCLLLPQGSALPRYEELSLSPEEKKRAGQTLKRLRSKYGGLVAGSFPAGIEMFERIGRTACSPEAPPQAARVTSCGGSVCECSVRPDGMVIPCDRLWGYTVGNVREQSFQSLWLDSEGFHRFRQRYNRQIDSFPECRGCPYVGVCKGGCPAIPYNTGRGIDGWDPTSCYMVYAGKKTGYV